MGRHLPLEQVVQSPIQPGLEHFQGGGTHKCSWQPVPVPYHPHSKEFLPCILSTSTFFQLEAITPCPIPTLPCKKSLSILSVGPFQVLKGCCMVSLEPSLLQDEQPQLSQPFVIGEVLHPSHRFCGPPLVPLQHIHVLLVLRPPELDAGLQVGSRQSGVEWQNSLLRPAGHASFDEDLDTVGLRGCERTLLGHVKLLVNHHPQVLLLRAALSPFSTQTVCKLGIALTQVQDHALGLVELHEVHMGPPVKPVKVPLDGIPSL